MSTSIQPHIVQHCLGQFTFTHYEDVDSDGGALCDDAGWGCAWRTTINVINALVGGKATQMTMQRLSTLTNGAPLPQAAWLDNLDALELILRWVDAEAIEQGWTGEQKQRHLDLLTHTHQNTIFFTDKVSLPEAQEKVVSLPSTDERVMAMYDPACLTFERTLKFLLECGRGTGGEDAGATGSSSQYGKFMDAIATAGEEVISTGQANPESPFRDAQAMFLRSFERLLQRQTASEQQTHRLQCLFQVVVAFHSYYTNPQTTKWVQVRTLFDKDTSIDEKDPKEIAALRGALACRGPTPAVICDGMFTDNVFGVGLSADGAHLAFIGDVHTGKCAWRPLPDTVRESNASLLQVTHYTAAWDGFPPSERKKIMAMVPITRCATVLLEGAEEKPASVRIDISQGRMACTVTQIGRPAGRVFDCALDIGGGNAGGGHIDTMAMFKPTYVVEPVLGAVRDDALVDDVRARFDFVLARQITEHLYTKHGRVFTPSVSITLYLGMSVPDAAKMPPRSWIVSVLSAIDAALTLG
eukprot:PhM_4_TR12013/c0_g1_i1/m.105248